jgi:hypothetical protein
MSTRNALLASLLSIMFTLWVGTHHKQQNIYTAATVFTPESATLEIHQRSGTTCVATKEDGHNTHIHCRKSTLRR